MKCAHIEASEYGIAIGEIAIGGTVSFDPCPWCQLATLQEQVNCVGADKVTQEQRAIAAERKLVAVVKRIAQYREFLDRKINESGMDPERIGYLIYLLDTIKEAAEET